MGGFDPDKESQGHGPPAGLPEMGRPDMRYGGRALDRIQHRERRGDKSKSRCTHIAMPYGVAPPYSMA